MCFGPSRAEKRAAAEQRVQADVAQQEAAQEKAKKKREDISEALTKRAQTKYSRGGAGRRSLMRSGGGGFLGRFE